jgi:DNA-3-methyladenine glycosylase
VPVHDKLSWTYSALWKATLPISLSAFAIPAPQLAQFLLSAIIFHEQTAGMIVETEAYLGADDLAAHSSRGVTPRTKVIFGPAGHAYIYLIYGMHECLNVVADVVGIPGCVLIRALEPLAGIPLMHERRQWHGPPKGLTNGPGKLTQALAITRAQYGVRLDRGPLTIRQWRTRPDFPIATTPRVGISQCTDWPLRFIWANHPCLSVPIRSPEKSLSRKERGFSGPSETF